MSAAEYIQADINNKVSDYKYFVCILQPSNASTKVQLELEMGNALGITLDNEPAVMGDVADQVYYLFRYHCDPTPDNEYISYKETEALTTQFLSVFNMALVRACSGTMAEARASKGIVIVDGSHMGVLWFAE